MLSMLIEQITKDLEIATRKQDPLVLKTLRFILSEIHYAKIEKQKDLTDDEVIRVLQKEVKKRNEAVEMMKKAGRMELVREEEQKLDVIRKYLPQEITEEELNKIVEQVMSELKTENFGQIISTVIQKTKGTADGKKIAELIKLKLQKT